MSKWAFKQIEPQPARGTLREEMWDSPDWIAEEKYDGDRRIAQFCGKGVRFTGRRISVKDGLFVEKTENVPHLSSYGPPLTIPDLRCTNFTMTKVPAALEGTVLDGEMVYGGLRDTIQSGNRGGESKFVTSIMGSLPEEAVRKQIERGWLRYVVFDCLFYKGKDLRGDPLEQRRQFMLRALEEWGNPFASPSEAVRGFKAQQSKRKFYDRIVERGGEGVILKAIHSPYSERSAWVKVKKQATADVVIMGFIPAKEMSKKSNGEVSMTKYAKAGLIGAIQCGQFPSGYDKKRGLLAGLVEVATVSGIDDALREAMTTGPGRFIGKVIEIEHNGREPTGRFRHPRFNRFRDDKRAKDCVYREDES